MVLLRPYALNQSVPQSESLPQQEPDTGPWFSSLRKAAGWLLEHYLPLGSLTAIAVTAFYGLAYARIYDSLGVTPEEVGFTPASILTHAAVGGLALLLLSCLLAFCTFLPVVPLRDDLIARAEKGSWRQVVANAALTLAGVAAMYASATVTGFSWAATLLAPSAVMLFFLTSFRRSRQNTGGPLEPRPLSFRLSRYRVMFVALALPLGLLATGAVTFIAADQVGKSIKKGEGLLGVKFAGVPFLRAQAEPATVSWFAEPSNVDMPDCVLYLGESEGEAVFYDARSDSSYRIPASEVVIRRSLDQSRCRGGDYRTPAQSPGP
ncbi:MAG TPA: hypothetical protein VFU16_11485 [Solirubrobacterales bacterium]|nr:hypothetical protein [Solirubrobacterales bacterium]